MPGIMLFPSPIGTNSPSFYLASYVDETVLVVVLTETKPIPYLAYGVITFQFEIIPTRII